MENEAAVFFVADRYDLLGCILLILSYQYISSAETIPAYPMLIASEGTTDLSTAAGAVGIMLNGVSVFRYAFFYQQYSGGGGGGKLYNMLMPGRPLRWLTVYCR